MMKRSKHGLVMVIGFAEARRNDGDPPPRRMVSGDRLQGREHEEMTGVFKIRSSDTQAHFLNRFQRNRRIR